MKLTREECEKAFKRLNGLVLSSPFEEDLIDYNDLKKCGTQLQDDFMDDVMMFAQLIEEYFKLEEQHMKLLQQWGKRDNPPLKFEELIEYFNEKKNRVYVWDICWNTWRQIKYIKEDTKEIQFYDCDYREKFEEDVFYKYQVD